MTSVRTVRSLTAILIGFLVSASCANASQLEPGLKAVEEIRGRKFKTDVRNVTIDRSELRKHLQEQMERSTPYSLDDWGNILRALQLVDEKTSDILPKLFDLYDSQVLAFYDPHSHTYYSIRQLPKLSPEMEKVVDPKMLEETVMVHELMHAMQDQLFSLSTREKTLMRDSDANLAYHSVLEGEAVLVMLAHMLKKMGVEDLSQVMKDDAMLATISSAAVSEQFSDPNTPRYFAESLKFPYLEGLKFVVAAYRRGGWKALDDVHANPPRSTREILHPDQYFARVAASKPGVAFDGTKPEAAIAVEHLGEFTWRYLVGEKNATGWVNDRVIIYKDGRVDASTTWDDAERANAFATAYSAFLESRGIKANVAKDGANVKVTYTAK